MIYAVLSIIGETEKPIHLYLRLYESLKLKNFKKQFIKNNLIIC